MSIVKVALVQMDISTQVSENLQRAKEDVKKAACQGAGIVVLPEMFCCPYASDAFVKYQEPQGGRIWQALCRMAADNKIYLVGGSMPESDNGHIYNTCFVFAPDGVQIAKHRKIHLFDVNIQGGQRFFESDTLSPGDQITVVNTAYGKIGVMICFDIRFQELCRSMALQGAEMIFVPAAFNMTTGPAHWEVHFRSRALDNQLFMFGCAPARDELSSYVSYGNSISVSPWGTVLQRLGANSGILIQEIQTDEIAKTRDQLPILKKHQASVYFAAPSFESKNT